MAQLGFGVDTAQFGRPDQRVDGGSALAARVGASKQQSKTSQISTWPPPINLPSACPARGTLTRPRVAEFEVANGVNTATTQSHVGLPAKRLQLSISYP